MTIQVCNDRSLASITSLPSGVSGSSLVLLETQTVSSSSTVSFTSNIDSTYKEYIFKFIDIHMATSDASFTVNFRDGGSNYDATKTTTFFRAYHNEGGSAQALTYSSSTDLAQSTSAQSIITSNGTDNDMSASGTLHLFDPSNTTFVKHFLSDCHVYHKDDYSQRLLVAGYANVTAAIDGVQFGSSSGNIDAGTIKMYGVV
jgi:hypothetical protein